MSSGLKGMVSMPSSKSGTNQRGLAQDCCRETPVPRPS